MIKLPLFQSCRLNFAKRAVILTAACGSILALPSRAETETWDISGNGTWDTSTANWSASSGSTWVDATSPPNDAVFGTGTAGTITIASYNASTAAWANAGQGGPSVDSIDFNQAGYTIGSSTGNGTIYLGAGTNNPGAGGAAIYIANTITTGAITINSNLVETALSSFLFSNRNLTSDTGGGSGFTLTDNGTINTGGFATNIAAGQSSYIFNGVISGSGAVSIFTDTSFPPTQLNALNTFTGAMTIN